MAVKDPEASSSGSFIVFGVSILTHVILLNMRTPYFRSRVISGVLLGIVFLIQSGITFAETDDADEVMRYRQQQQQAYDALNRSNPFSPNYSGNPQTSTPPPKGTSALDPNYPFAQIQRIISNPVVQGFLRFFSNPAIATAADKILNSPYKAQIFYLQVGWLIFFILFRGWRLSKIPDRNWPQKMLLRTWTTLAFLIGSMVVIPGIYLGDSYYKLIYGAYWAIIHGTH